MSHTNINIDSYVQNYKIFIDTCSLLHPGIDNFWQMVVPVLEKYGEKIYIPLACKDELEKHAANKNNPTLAKDAKKALFNIKTLLDAKLIDIRQDKNNHFADNVFLSVFTKFRIQYKLLLITQDSDLANDMLGLNKNKSVKANPVEVKHLDDKGILNSFHNKKQIGNNCEKIDVSEKFKMSAKITDIPETIISVKETPSKGSTLFMLNGSNFEPVKILREINSGGEANIYETNTPYLAKIYKKDNLNLRKKAKTELMLSKKLECNGICFPVKSLYNAEKQFVGYLMPKGKGREIQRSLFVKQLLYKNFPNWKKKDMVKLCITILEKIKYLHDRNIIMGDINPANILVESPTEVYFVDTDSYQIEGFPCPVGTKNYTAPEIQRKNYRHFLRTMGNENFAVATLLFMIMLPGKPPYCQQGGENMSENIVAMDFSYPFNGNSNKKAPVGPWRFMWSHLPFDIKKAFYNTFKKNMPNSIENTRLSVDAWLQKFNQYFEILSDGSFGSQDKMSEEIFPTRHKKIDNINYIKCKICNNEIQEENCKDGICPTCLRSGEKYNCSRCGVEIVFTNFDKHIKNRKKHRLCHDCFNYTISPCQPITCRDCGDSFTISQGEREYFTSKGLSLPKRCSACRKNRSSENIPANTFESEQRESFWDVLRNIFC